MEAVPLYGGIISVVFLGSQRRPFEQLCRVQCMEVRRGRNPSMVDGNKRKLKMKKKELETTMVDSSLPSSSSAYQMSGWEMDEIDSEFSEYRGLVLDLTYRPISIVCWRRALCLEILEKADVLEYYDEVVRSPGRDFPIPAVLRISNYVHTPKRKKPKIALNRNNIFLRDRFKCQYCGTRDGLTVDHVFPASRGGGWTWENLVTACSHCNSKKGHKTLEEASMELIRPPKEPKETDSGDFPSNYSTYVRLNGAITMPDKWLDYLSR